MLLYIVYGILFVNTVDTKIKACNALNAMFVKTGVCGSYTAPCIEYYEVWKHQYQQSQHSIAFNALYALIFVSFVLTILTCPLQ